MEECSYEEETEDAIHENEREHHWRIYFKENNRGICDNKELLHAKRWDLDMSDKRSLQ